MRVKFPSILVLVFLVQVKCFAGEKIRISGDELQPTISVRISGDQLSFLSYNLQENAKGILSLHMVRGGIVASLPVSGKYILESGTLSFTSLYRLGNGLVYEVHYHRGPKLVKSRFTTPQASFSKDQAKVIRIYPIADTVPVNILFFHVRFSHPMADDIKAYTYVQLSREDGTIIQDTWRQRSFWLDSMRVLVLMIHPGRVKNGIHYTGAVFEMNKKYTITVQKEIKDMNGHALKKDVIKQFVITGEDRVLPEIAGMSKTVKAGTRNPLIIAFSEGMDHASCIDGLKIYYDGKESVSCTIRENENDRNVIVIPEREWKKGSYKVLFESVVSDFAANRTNRLFEIKDIKEKEKDMIEVSRYFEIK
ncbi:MAG: hypothetical protein V4651_09195 [Bacteroidota bacterium]